MNDILCCFPGRPDGRDAPQENHATIGTDATRIAMSEPQATGTTEGGPRRYITVGERAFVLLGTAHVSRASAEEVKTEIETGDYDEVAIELCDARHAVLTREDEVAQMDLFAVIKNGQAGMVAANLALTAYQQRLADQFGIEPGAEMRAAMAS